ncbi:RNA-binding RNA annealing protein [Marasmius sp. AFHP31]|nr:RNA-binding RNA annealing protein [Marasmius sp. AFHP31]
MKIEIVVDPTRPASLASRVAPAATPAATTQNNAARAPARAGRGRGGKGGRGGKRKSPRPQKSAADLDAEMEDYTGNNAAAAPAAAA